MSTKGRRPARRTAAKTPDDTAPEAPKVEVPKEVRDFIRRTSIPKGYNNPKKIDARKVRERLRKHGLRPTVDLDRYTTSVNCIKPIRARESEETSASVEALAPRVRMRHGTRFKVIWFPWRWWFCPCESYFGYMSSSATRSATALPFNATTKGLLDKLGALMADVGQDPNPSSQNPADAGVSKIPAGYTYFGQFVDHDITLDTTSSLDAATNANSIRNMRSPTLDLDNVYGDGPALDPFLYEFPSSGDPTAVKLQTGTNTASGAGGPAPMVPHTDWDVPRVTGSNTAVIGDPRNDENLIVSQFQHAMLRFHNAVVDMLVAAGFSGDVFAEAKRIVTHHYQWAVVNDFLKRVCGPAAVNAAMATATAPICTHFRMPVEFAVAAYRFGHSMIRNEYWVNFNFPNASLSQVFQFIRPPLLPVLSNWVVDFNAFFETGRPVPVFNMARRIDSHLANGLEHLPGMIGLMAILAARNLRRGLALGLPSGQGMAGEFGITPLTAAQLKQGLQANEKSVLEAQSGLLLRKTPLWYYVLREAAVLEGGNRLGPVGARIVAETFVRMLKRDAASYLNVPGGFAPMLPSATAGAFTVADLVEFAGVTVP